MGEPPVLTVVRADPPRAWSLLPKRGWVGRNETSAFDVSMTYVRREIRHMRRVCEKSLPSFDRDLHNGQLFFEGFPLPPAVRRLEALEAVRENLRDFYSVVPAEIRTFLLDLDAGQYSVWALLYRSNAARDLIESNPFLLWLLAHRKRYMEKPGDWRRACRIATKKQREIIGALDYGPAAQSVVRALRKVPTAEFNYWFSYRLRDALRDETARTILGYLPHITDATVRIVNRPELRAVVNTDFLEELGRLSHGSARKRYYALCDTVWYAEACGRPVRKRQVRSLETGERLFRDVRHMYDEMEAKKRYANIIFPEPPLPGTAHITPIETAPDLYAEGRAQEHCCAEYARQVACDGNTYLYRVLEPERCTLAIIFHNRMWTIRECRTAKNGRVGSETRKAIARWLRDSQKDSVPKRQCNADPPPRWDRAEPGYDPVPDAPPYHYDDDDIPF